MLFFSWFQSKCGHVKRACVHHIFTGHYFFTSLATLLPFFCIIVALFVYVLSNRSNSSCPAQLSYYTPHLSVDHRTCTSCLNVFCHHYRSIAFFYIHKYIYIYIYITELLLVHNSSPANLMKGIHLYSVTFFNVKLLLVLYFSRVRL